MAVLLHPNSRTTIQHIYYIAMSKTEVPTDGVSVHLTIPLAILMTNVPTDGVSNTGVLTDGFSPRFMSPTVPTDGVSSRLTFPPAMFMSYVPTDGVSKTEVPTDGVSVHLPIPLTIPMTNVPTDGASTRRWTNRWRQYITSVLSSPIHALFQDRGTDRWRSISIIPGVLQPGRLKPRPYQPNHHHARAGWHSLTNSKAIWITMMLLCSLPWVHGPFSGLHTFARSPWLQPTPLFLPLQDPGSASCMWGMCTPFHANVTGEQSKTEVHVAPPSEMFLRRERWCPPTTNIGQKVSKKGSGVPAGAQNSLQSLTKGAGVPEGAQNYLETSKRGSGVPAGAQSSPKGISEGAGVPEGAQITVDNTLKGTWGTCGGPEYFSHWLIYPATQVSLHDAPKFVPMGPWPIPRTPNPCPQSMAAALSNFLPFTGSGEQVASLPLERRFGRAGMAEFKFRIEWREITARKAVKIAG